MSKRSNPSEKELVLITGATGFIGCHLTKYLIKRNYRVRVLVRQESSNLGRLDNLDIDICFGDITHFESISKAFKNVSKVFHCAAYVSDWGKKEDYINTNILGTENVLKACVEYDIERYIGISTNDVFGRNNSEILNENMPLTKWNEPYPDSKIEADRLAWQFHKNFGLAVSLSYPCWVYGPEDTTFLPHLIDAIKDGSFLYWKKDAHFYPTYIGNLLDHLHTISNNEVTIGEGYLVHDGSSISLKSFCDKISEELTLKKVKLKIPYGLAHSIAFAMEGIWRILKIKNRPLLTTYIVKNFGSQLHYSIEKSKKQLNWIPKFSFEEGFEETLNSLK